jgi:hypothetical protein
MTLRRRVQHGADFAKSAAQAYGGVPLREATHGTMPWLDAAVILFQVVVYITAGPVHDSILKDVTTRAPLQPIYGAVSGFGLPR